MIVAQLLIIFFLLVIFLIFYIRNRHLYWARRKVPYLQPKNFLLGNSGDVFFNKTSLFEYHSKIYNELPHSAKFGGYFHFLRPVLVVRDPELIKKILTKNFNHFMNRGAAFTDENEALSLHIFNLSGERWRILRNKLTATFTSSKLKAMYYLMEECCDQLVNVIEETINKGDEAIEVKDLMARFTTDVISTCAFGLESNSLKNPDSIFRTMGKKIFAPSLRSRFIGIFSTAFPHLRRLLNISFFDKDVKEFFESIVLDTVKYREENNIQRNDFIDLLIALRNEMKNPDTGTYTEEGNLFELSDKLMIAQCFVFFAAGFETSSGTLTFALYELARNKNIQNKLFTRIIDGIEDYHNELSYQCIHDIQYVDQVVNEILRMYPILPFLVRTCNAKCRLSEDYTVDVGTRVIISVLGLHFDDRYYKNPNEFNPEHFSDRANYERHPYTYLPFGGGPRMCIGLRFGLTQVKLALITLIKNYQIGLASNMDENLKFSTSSFLANVDGGVWLTFKRRDGKSE